jgi:hypothetical protein
MPHETDAAFALFTRYTVAAIPRDDSKAAIDAEIAELISTPGPVRAVAEQVIHAAFLAAGWTLLQE